MKRRSGVARPRKRAREKGAAGVDRAPLRLFRTAERYCPKGACWVGAGSPFANPFAVASARFETGPMRNLVDAAARRARGPKPEVFGPFNTFGPPPVTDDERATALAWLYRLWRAGKLGTLPRSIARFFPELDSPLPAPPTADEIRAALAGRDLVDSAPDGWPTHANELLRVANAPLQEKTQ